MASDSKTTKAAPAPKKETGAKETPKPASEAAAAKPAAPADAEAPAASQSYSRGEGQKPVSQAYRDNWNAIFRKKKRTKR